MQPINEAVSVMIVGMITVFFILVLILGIGNIIIRLSNKYLPEEVVVKDKKRSKSPNNTYAAIAAAIDIVTMGKGKVKNIKKLEL